ncbi:MAG: hypothetical protein ROO73_02090 [Roseivirga sp.]
MTDRYSEECMIGKGRQSGAEGAEGALKRTQAAFFAEGAYLSKKHLKNITHDLPF